ncbi:Dabb family protein [Actinomadura sp. WMMB 499]|uniref:Dabb family protein n=1 Tax=Actinomadura sp. WMMB 499 TaxID=1219491 RepID=UPI0012481284|nr:Dabb family protein [Actinomadura sp. WMMB 499]QFG25543.1 Dabb family protein [Actinomadura sp. WMMB 499]
MSGFRHVVMFKWAEGTTTGQQEEVAARLSELPGLIPEIREYVMGTDAGLSPGAYDFVVVADFADADAFRVYRDHPAHRTVADDLIAPIMAERAVVQHER